jgi:hypothetical protein
MDKYEYFLLKMVKHKLKMEMLLPEQCGGDLDKIDVDAVILGDLDTMDQNLDRLEEQGLE